MRSTPYFLAMISALGVSAQAMSPQGSAYNKKHLYNETSEHASFNAEVMRGMELFINPESKELEALYAIHSYQSSVVHYDIVDSPPVVTDADNANRWKTITDPVALAIRGDYVYVLGQGSHALAKHHRISGDVLEVMMLTSNPPNSSALKYQRLGSEPADMVVTEDGTLAYISLMGADAVVAVDLATMTEAQRWQTTNTSTYIWKRPRFLALDEGNKALYIAPFLSGNGTFTVRDGDGVRDGLDSATGLSTTQIHRSTSITSGLPDHDLFKLHLPSGAVTAVVKEAGTLLTAHGVHGEDYWMLGIESRNADFVSEPAMRGDFARNVLSKNNGAGFLTIPVPTAPPENGTELDLDDPTGAQAYSEAESIPFPYAMAMDGPAGVTAIASSTLSRVAIYDAAGTARTLINLEDDPLADHYGRVIRSVAFAENGDLYIYCQQTSNIIVWPIDATGTPAPAASHSYFLGADPTARRLAEGRDLFYDATKSQNHRFTCATCHPGGESDVLNWELKDALSDFKDPMLTQTLKGLRETFPFHWRGERSLSDFNGAFGGLLGNDLGMAMTTNLTDAELEVFEDFIFSLRPAANPHALVERTMEREYQPLGSDQTGLTGKGLILYQNNGAQGDTCADCHPLPTGGFGLTTPDNISGNLRGLSTNGNMEMIQLSNFLQAREQRIVTLMENGASFPRSSLGSGFRHNSGARSVFGLVRNQFLTSAFGGQITSVAHVAAFIQAMDTSTPPAAHAAIHWVYPGSAAKQALVGDLRKQAKAGWIDVVAFGKGPAMPSSTLPTQLSWVYDPMSSRWMPDDRINALPVTTAQLLGLADGEVTILGTPDGQGHRLGVDYDNDQIFNKGEPGNMTDPWNPDSDGDTEPDGYENISGGSAALDSTDPLFLSGPSVVPNFTTGSTALVKFSTNEPVTWTLKATPYEFDPGTGLTTQSSRFDAVTSKGTSRGTIHTAHIHGLGASFHDAALAGGTSTVDLSYDLLLVITDIAGNTTATSVTESHLGLEAAEAIVPNLVNQVVVDEFVWDPAMADPGLIGPSTFEGTGIISIRRYTDTAVLPDASDLIVLAQVQKRGGLPDDEWEAVPDNMLVHTAPNYVSSTTINPIVDLLTPTGDVPTDYGSLIGNTATYPLIVFGATDANGVAPPVTVTVSGATSTDSFRIQVVGIAPMPSDPVAAQYNPAAPEFPSLGAFTVWTMPLTTKDKRALTYIP